MIFSGLTANQGSPHAHKPTMPQTQKSLGRQGGDRCFLPLAAAAFPDVRPPLRVLQTKAVFFPPLSFISFQPASMLEREEIKSCLLILTDCDLCRTSSQAATLFENMETCMTPPPPQTVIGFLFMRNHHLLLKESTLLCIVGHETKACFY